jgi:4-methyl-5(b-hydroxyethyl)-thiazole monophosphate biosynthesis
MKLNKRFILMAVGFFIFFVSYNHQAKAETAPCPKEASATTNAETPTKKVLLIATDGMEDIEIAAVREICGWTKVVEDIDHVDVQIGAWDNPVHLFHGTNIIPDLDMKNANIDDFDAIVIPGGWPGTKFFELTFSDEFANFLKKAHEKNKLIVAHCFGILPIANSGIIKGKQATIFTSNTPLKCEEFKGKLIQMGVKYVDEAIHYEDNVMSSIGPAVANEVAFQLVEKLIGTESTKKIQDMMMWQNVAPEDLKWTAPTRKK